MNPVASPSIYEAYNARPKKPQEVAATFVAGENYDRLIRPENTLVVGARGTGKTTLLKMLQGPALEAWRDARAPVYRDEVRFTGVFVPTDIAWSQQVRTLAAAPFRREHREAIVWAAFVQHVLRCLIEAMAYRIGPTAPGGIAEGMDMARGYHGRLPLDLVREEQLSRRVADILSLPGWFPTLAMLRDGLSKRLSRLREFAEGERLLQEAGRGDRIASERFMLQRIPEVIIAAIDAFETATDVRGELWAFLFDELELAPDFILDGILRQMRSTDSRLLWKVSVSPYTPDLPLLKEARGPVAGNDYTLVRLWSAHRQMPSKFSEDLLGKTLGAGAEKASLEQLLGRSEFDTGPEEWAEKGTAYGPGSKLAALYGRLADKDPTFQHYLAERGISPANLERADGMARAAEVRKLRGIVLVRDAYRRADDSSGGRDRSRSRKGPPKELYTGRGAVVAVLEENPRWLIGVGTSWLSRMKGAGLRVSRAAQARELEEAVHRFRALLSTFPCDAVDGTVKSVLKLVDRIGFRFHEIVVKEAFNSDPPGSFLVDSHTREAILEGLGMALNAGAIVFVPDNAVEALLPAVSSFKGKRFRLSYLFAPFYGLPLSLGRPVSLAGLIGRDILEHEARQTVLPLS